METKSSIKPAPGKILAQTIQTFKNNPAVYAPFAAYALLELVALIVIFLAPRMPLKPIFGPPIRAFWGEKFLHYPMNFLLLPKLASISRNILTVIAGALLYGIAIAKLYGRPVKTAFKKYVTLFLIILLLTIIFYAIAGVINKGLLKYFMAGNKKLLFFGPRIWLGPILYALNFIAAVLVQSAFIYAIPILFKHEYGLLKILVKAFNFFRKNFAITLMLVGLPMLIYVPIMILNARTAFMISNFFPESVLYTIILSIILSSLIIDPLITIAAALFYSKEES